MLCSECEKARFPFLYSKPAAAAAEPGDNVVTSKRQLILNDVLCFINNKFHNHPVSVIKSTMMDFYREDELLSAKQVLLQCVSDKSLIASLQLYAKKNW